MTDLASISQHLQTSLDLQDAPIGIWINPPDNAGLSSYRGNAAAGCVFWQQGTQDAFVTRTQDHALCSIGVHTHNMADPPESQSAELGATLDALKGLGYARDEEVARIPYLEQPTREVAYGPLGQFDQAPDVVMVLATSRQGLVIAEAVARVDQGFPVAMGRPACAIIPQVVNTKRAAMSLGCCGARAYLDRFSDDIALWAFPGNDIEAYAVEIEALASANQTLTEFHRLRGEDVAAGQRPTVQESLHRLSCSSPTCRPDRRRSSWLNQR